MPERNICSITVLSTNKSKWTDGCQVIDDYNELVSRGNTTLANNFPTGRWLVLMQFKVCSRNFETFK